MPDLVIMRLDKARTALLEAKTIQETKQIMDVAAAAGIYARRQQLGEEAIGYAHEIKIQALARLGALLKEMPKAKNTSGLKHGPVGSPSEPTENRTLAELGINKKTSMIAQRLAALPESTRREIAQREVSLRDVIRTIKRVPDPAPIELPEGCRTVSTIQELIDEGEIFTTIYADPPWQYSNQATRAATDNHYSTMTVEQLCYMPIGKLADDNAHLHLWTTNAFLFEAKRVMESWGFEYKSLFVWCKPQMGIGNYWRVSHEFLLFGLKGNLPFQDRGQMSWAAIDRSGHSEKPEEIRNRVESVSPGPYLELFGRLTRPGWTIFGNQIYDPAAPRQFKNVGGPLFVGGMQ